MTIDPERLVFVGEAGAATAMTPAHGRAPAGGRVGAPAPASWESVTPIAAMGPDGARAPLTSPGAVDAVTLRGPVEWSGCSSRRHAAGAR